MQGTGHHAVGFAERDRNAGPDSTNLTCAMPRTGDSAMVPARCNLLAGNKDAVALFGRMM